MLNFIKYIDFINDYYMIFKIYYIVKHDYRIFKIRERIKFARLKRIITIKILL